MASKMRGAHIYIHRLMLVWFQKKFVVLVVVFSTALNVVYECRISLKVSSLILILFRVKKNEIFAYSVHSPLFKSFQILLTRS